MSFKETEKKMYVIVKNDDSWRPKFYVNGKWYWSVSGIIRNVEKETKKIVPSKWPNAWKEVIIHNLVLDMVSTDWEFELQLPFYSSLSRNTLNALAWPDTFDEVFFSIYNNKKGFRSMSIRKSEDKDDYVTPKYNREQELGMVKTITIKWEDKKDYDWLIDKRYTEMLPEIQKKLWNKEAIVVEKAPVTEEDDLPF